MNMFRIQKRSTIRMSILTFLLIGIMLLLWPSLRGWAMPAAPGSYGDTGEFICPSEAAEEKVTLEVLEKKKQEKMRREQESDGVLTASKTRGDSQYSIPLLVIVVGFRGSTAESPYGLPYSDSCDWGQRLFRNEDSVTAYYRDMSLGKFTFTPASETSCYGTGGNTNLYDQKNDGIVHVTIDKAHGMWGELTNLDRVSFYAAAQEALQRSSEYVDYSAFDTDQDGDLTNAELALCFVMAGYDASVQQMDYFGTDRRFLWPFSFSFTELGQGHPVVDGVSPERFISMAELQSPGKEKPAYLSVILHELGHYLGLPDLYNTESTANPGWNSYAVEKMSLMARGCWGLSRDGDFTCYSLDVWSRYQLGWLSATDLTEDSSVVVTGDDLYYIPSAQSSEYYLVENHRFTGWDRDMAYGIASTTGEKVSEIREGLVIWHIDRDAYQKYVKLNRVNGWSHRPAVMPLYPECLLNGNWTLITDLWAGGVLLDPFYTVRSMNGSLQLPCYGGRAGQDNRSDRFLSGIRLAVNETDNEKIRLTVTYDSAAGALPRGWVTSRDNRYYYSDAGTPEKNTWKQEKLSTGRNTWMYLNGQGTPVTGWKKISGKWYFFNEEGIMQKGWIKQAGKWYYLDGSGAMKKGWIKQSGKWYYLGADGAMRTGWLKCSGKWYFLDGSGVMKTGWKKIAGVWYYFDADGVMATGTQKIDGKTYHFQSSGAWID